MKHTGIRFRLTLPAVLGFLAIVLMVWDYENNRMVELMGMGWIWVHRSGPIKRYTFSCLRSTLPHLFFQCRSSGCFDATRFPCNMASGFRRLWVGGGGLARARLGWTRCVVR